MSTRYRNAHPSAVATNRRFYEGLWSATSIVSPDRFNTWPLLSQLAGRAARRLEVGPGLRPRLPIAGTHFLDVSGGALARLRQYGGLPAQSDVTALPYRDATFDLVCAFDIVEHVEDDRQILRELRRVSRPGAAIVFSVPLDPSRWSAFDDLVGHVHRYQATELQDLIQAHDLVLERSAIFGMEPRSRLLLQLAAWGMRHHPEQAMRWYNTVIMPLGLRLQRPLALAPGMIDVTGVGEILLVCRRAGGS